MLIFSCLLIYNNICYSKTHTFYIVQYGPINQKFNFSQQCIPKTSMCIASADILHCSHALLHVAANQKLADKIHYVEIIL